MVKVNYQGRDVEARPVEFNVEKEAWSEYRLAGGAQLRLKTVLSEVLQLEGEVDADGNPVYVTKSGSVLAFKTQSDAKHDSKPVRSPDGGAAQEAVVQQVGGLDHWIEVVRQKFYAIPEVEAVVVEAGPSLQVWAVLPEHDWEHIHKVLDAGRAIFGMIMDAESDISFDYHTLSRDGRDMSGIISRGTPILPRPSW